MSIQPLYPLSQILAAVLNEAVAYQHEAADALQSAIQRRVVLDAGELISEQDIADCRDAAYFELSACSKAFHEFARQIQTRLDLHGSETGLPPNDVAHETR